MHPAPPYVSTSGFDCHDVAVVEAPQKDGAETSRLTVVMEEQKLMIYDQATSEFRLLFGVESRDTENILADQTNYARFRVSYDQQTLCFMDNYRVATIDIRTRMEIASKKRRFDASNCNVNEIFVSRSGSFFIAQLDCSISKYSTMTCKETHSWHSTGKVLDMQVEEPYNRILILCSPSQGVYYI